MVGCIKAFFLKRREIERRIEVLLAELLYEKRMIEAYIKLKDFEQVNIWQNKVKATAKAVRKFLEKKKLKSWIKKI